MSDPISISIAQKAVDVLNEALKADRQAVTLLLLNRVGCNEKLAAHPTIQVLDNAGPAVGILGIINGIVERQTGEQICALWDEDVKEILGFDLYSKYVAAS